MKKVIAFLSAAVLSASLLAGCGGSAAPAATTAAPAASAASETKAEETTAAETKAEETTAAASEAKTEETAAETTADAEGTVTITDHADRTVTVPTDPKNVVVLDIYPIPSVLTVFLNSAEPLKAIAPVSMNAAKNGILSELYPEILDARTDILDGDDVNIEALAAMEPDLVIYTASNKKIQEKLEPEVIMVLSLYWNRKRTRFRSFSGMSFVFSWIMS